MEINNKTEAPVLLTRAVVRLISSKPFYGHLIQQFEKTITTSPAYPTACVGKKKDSSIVHFIANKNYTEELFKDYGLEGVRKLVEHETLHCFPAGTLVSGEFDSIENITKGSIIIGSDGERHKVAAVASRDYHGGLVKIEGTGVHDIFVTDNHRILVADIGWKTINTSLPRRNVRLIRNVDWKDSQNVKVGDWLAIPRIKGYRADSYIPLEKYFSGNEWSHSDVVKTGKMPLNEDTAWLMGYYCAEGWSDNKGGGIGFAMHVKEMITHGAKASKIINNQLSLKTRIVPTEDSLGAVLHCNSSIIARMLHDKIGTKAWNKSIPDEIFYHKDERIVKSFLRGYFDGDGAVSSRLFSAATVSKKLAFQIQALSVRFGCMLNVMFDELSKNPPVVIVKGPPRFLKDQWRLFTNGDDFRHLLGYTPFEKKARITRWHVVTDEFVFIRVSKVSRNPEWKGKVYNLRSPTQDYLVNNVVVHNCSLGHLFLQRPDKIRWNVALDMCVNSFIDSVPKGWMTAEMFSLPTQKSGVWYYDQLKDNKKFKEMVAKGAFSGMGDHGYVGDDTVAKETLRKSIEQSKEVAGSAYGNLPSDMKEMIEAALKREVPPIPWTRLLRLYVASMLDSSIRFTLKRESDRFGTRPGPVQEEVLNVLVAIDTSGSVSSKQLAIFLSEIKWMWKNDFSVSICEADADVAKKPYKYQGENKIEINGRGGTDLNPALREADEGRYDLCIYFTDFEAPPVQQCRTPVIWVLTKEYGPKEGPASFGRRITLQDADR